MIINPRLARFWNLPHSDPKLYHHCQKVNDILFVKRSLKREYKLQELLPVFAYAGIGTAEVKFRKSGPTIVAKGLELFKARHLLNEFESLKNIRYDEERLESAATIITKFRTSPKSWWLLKGGV